jgi:hypothetical protein
MQNSASASYVLPASLLDESVGRIARELSGGRISYALQTSFTVALHAHVSLGG